MDYVTFKDCIRRSGFGIKEFAELIGMNRKSISNYSSRTTVPEHLALIALLMVELEHRDVNIKEIVAKLRTLDLRDFLKIPIRKSVGDWYRDI
jgi:hypothetical protein